MKSIGIAVFLVSISATVQAQSIGDLAKAERQRQHAVGSVPVITKVEISYKEDTAAGATANPAEESKAAPSPTAEQPKASATAEQVKASPSAKAEVADLEREKAGLLMKLKEVIHDRKAVQDIEQRLGEIQKRMNELKQDNKQENAPKAEVKGDHHQK